jgi:tetraacyldisaccharide 4'-kinase
MDYRSIMDGSRRDPLAMLIRTGLSVASVPYRIAIAIRNFRYDSGRLEIHHAGVPVICVGNLTTGGTGKTPVVCYLATALRSRSVRVSIVSRGYGRGQAASNDEALELHERLPDVPQVQDPDRVEAARIAVEELDTQVILMDDGFQHRRLHRDLNIVVIDATCPFGYNRLLPRGLLREPIASIRRADLAIITRTSQVGSSTIEQIKSTIGRYHPTLDIITSDHLPSRLRVYPDQFESIENLNGRRVAIVSGIGNPAAFETTVKQCGAMIIGTHHLPDHDAYDRATVDEIRNWLKSISPIDRIVCTHKDLVKLATDQLDGVQLAAIEIELSVTDDGRHLETRLQQIESSLGHRDAETSLDQIDADPST